MRKALVVSGIIGFLIAGYFFVPEPIREVAHYLWLGTVLLLTVLGVAFALGMVRWMWAGAARAGLVFPDENGNYPIRMSRRIPDNINLAGSESLTGGVSPAWALCQATKNQRSEPQTRELFKQGLAPVEFPPPPIIGRGEQDVPKILIEAKSVGGKM